MKFHVIYDWFVVIVVCALIGAVVFAAQPAQLDEPKLVSISALLVYGADGKLTSLPVVANYSVPFAEPDGKTVSSVIRPVTFDLIREGKESVDVYYDATKQTVVVNLEEIAADLVAACRKKYSVIYVRDHPDPLPVRKALRTTK